MPTELERNKANVMAFCDLAFNESRPAEAMERYAGTATPSTTRMLPMASRLSSTTSSG